MASRSTQVVVEWKCELRTSNCKAKDRISSGARDTRYLRGWVNARKSPENRSHQSQSRCNFSSSCTLIRLLRETVPSTMSMRIALHVLCYRSFASSLCNNQFDCPEDRGVTTEND